MAPTTNFKDRETSVQIHCGQTRTLVLDVDTGEWVPVVWYCRQATCLLCSKIKSKRQRNSILKFVGEMPVAHLVLTVARYHRPLREAVGHLFGSFRTLKRRSYWRRYVLGGVRFFDCAYNRDEGIWGPHFHLLVETASDSSVARLRKEWVEITGGSWVVDESEVSTEPGERTAKVTYVAKPAYLSFADDEEAMTEYRQAMKGKRLGAVIGNWYGKLKLSRQRVVVRSGS